MTTRQDNPMQPADTMKDRQARHNDIKEKALAKGLNPDDVQEDEGGFWIPIGCEVRDAWNDNGTEVLDPRATPFVPTV